MDAREDVEYQWLSFGLSIIRNDHVVWDLPPTSLIPFFLGTLSFDGRHLALC